MRKIRFASIYLFSLAIIFFFVGAFTEWHTISLMKFKPLGYPKHLHLIFFLAGFLALCAIYFAEKMEVNILSSMNTALQEEIALRNQTEKALRKSEDKNREIYSKAKRAEQIYRSLLHSSADAIATYDLKGRTVYISPAFTKIFGWTLEEMKGKRMPFVPQSESESTMAIIRNLVEDGTQCQGFETKRYAKDGRLLDVSISASRYNDHEGNPIGTLVILRDISEKKRLESQLQYIERMEAIGTLAGGIAHDFNNLMMGMLGNISLILYDIGSESPYYEKLKNIEKLIQSGSKLTSQLLGYARKGKYEVRPINLNQLVEESSETFGRTRKEIVIHREFAEDLSSVMADEAQIQQILMNLFINAADAMPGGGDLFLKTLNVTHEDIRDKPYKPRSGDYILLKVSDTGTGMGQKVMDRIFEPFFTTKDLGRGSGLGLASVYGIIKGHDGYIDVESEKGLGAIFSIYLPASEKSIQKTLEIPERIMEGNENILLVDDEALVINVGVQLLKKLGYTVLEAQSGREAIKIFMEGNHAIDMVILDMVMPDMSGGEVYDRIKRIDSNVKVLLSSGYSIDGQATEILKRGCEGFIQKPYSMEDFSKKIREVLNKPQKSPHGTI
ncbi:MAG: PAS domain S-box protein [Deltaproteobacteria bacterium]|nr:PAS domain S-box protein [Deltaproteobacteria bacterium]MBW1747020.1 PAS domain S-box protein [Deltaproteobacteria bacterium]MBW1968456.1 PAS domain S-box protein [Deltaproteobacteria bacterium]MBW2155221.1 PAS domain S-box protein [Deltaproteobacteria bacterium]MBW2196276.1 PAS domain S-box protein [Deltaproteobacteria bacterium]